MKEKMTMEDLDALEAQAYKMIDAGKRAVGRILDARLQLDESGKQTIPGPQCPPNLPGPWPWCDGTMPAITAILPSQS